MGILNKSEGNSQKPRFSEYIKHFKKSGGNPEEVALQIESVRLSHSEEWIIIESSECSALIHSNSICGSEFWEVCQTLSGRGRALLLVSTRDGKDFDVEVDEQVTGYWSQGENEVYFSIKKPRKSSPKLSISSESILLKEDAVSPLLVSGMEDTLTSNAVAAIGTENTSKPSATNGSTRSKTRSETTQS